MSTKFEQLLDFLVNEEHEKANELFHEIVVEKSREIYENLIAEEEEGEQDESVEEDSEDQDESVEEDSEDQDESVEEDSEDQDESVEEDSEEADESVDLEDSYMMDGDDEHDPADKLALDVGAGDDHGDSEEGHEASEDEAIMDIKNAIQELEAAFAELEAAQGGEKDGMGAKFGDEEDDEEDEVMGQPAMESKKRITREYRETVGNDWEKNSQKTQGQYVGGGTGDKDGAPQEGKSVVNKEPGGKPQSGANAKNLVQGATGDGGSNTGTSPNKPQKGINPESGEKFAKGLHNVDGVKSGVKTLSKVAGGHGAEKKGSGPGPVGSGTGDKAGQTSVRNDGPLIKKL